MRSVKQICIKNLTVSTGPFAGPEVAVTCRDRIAMAEAEPVQRYFRPNESTIGWGDGRISRARHEPVKAHIDRSQVHLSYLT